MKELKSWAFDSKMPLVETKTYDENNQTLEAYCLDFKESNGDYILGLWIRVPTSKTGLGSVRKDTTPEKALVSHTSIDKNRIPGYPAYFFISPSRNLLATLPFDNGYSGIQAFRHYIRGYLRNYCSHIVNRMEGEDRISGLCTTSSIGLTEETDGRIPSKDIRPSVVFSVEIENINKEYYLNHASDIVKVAKDLHTEELRKDDNCLRLESVVRAFKDLPITSRRKSRVVLPVNLTRGHVSKIFSDYEKSDGSDEYNVGFIVRGEPQKIHWLAGCTKVMQFSGQVTFHSKDQPDLDTLMPLMNIPREDSNERSQRQLQPAVKA
ncbi:hypothetical protein QNE43_003817 [Vibrio vulnificus]|nr:hypothetical protein [Vibrio vulnificus]